MNKFQQFKKKYSTAYLPVFVLAMVSESLAKVRIEQGCHGHLGGAFGNCVEAKEAGVRMSGKNDAERKDPGVCVP